MLVTVLLSEIKLSSRHDTYFNPDPNLTLSYPYPDPFSTHDPNPNSSPNPQYPNSLV